MENLLSLFTNDFNDFEKRTNYAQITWEGFSHGKEVVVAEENFREILLSWERCRERDLNFYEKIGEKDDGKEFDRNYSDQENRIMLLAPILKDIAETLSLPDSSINIYNSNLFLIGSFCNEKSDLGSQETVACMREDIAGTNAINLSFGLKRPFITIGYENYKSKFHNKIFASIPLMGPDNSCYGVVGVESALTLLYKSMISILIPVQKYFLDQFGETPEKVRISYASRINDVIMENIDQAIIMTDSSGVIVSANKNAEHYLNAGEVSLVGVDIRKIWRNENPFISVLRDHKKRDSIMQILSTRSSSIVVKGSVVPILALNKSIIYVIGIFNCREKLEVFCHEKKMIAKYTFDDIIGSSSELSKVINVAQMTAKMDINVIIQGESGTGKELFAHAIHNASNYCKGPFVVVNCAAIPSSLLESELFGYEGGAFTGAKKEGGMGKFELASGGTIFLDEINSMPMDMQAKILRTVQMKTITRVGGSKDVPINARIMAATNVDLWKLVKNENFREDLYFRLNVMSFVIPPLRERKEDIDLFIEFKKNEISSKIHWSADINNDGMEILRNYNYPGNIRELENILERSYVLAAAKNSYIITAEDLMSYRGIQEYFGEIDFTSDKQQSEISEVIVKHSSVEKDFLIDGKTINEIEEEAIKKALEASGGNIRAAADMLGFARNTLYRKIKNYNLKSKPRG